MAITHKTENQSTRRSRAEAAEGAAALKGHDFSRAAPQPTQQKINPRDEFALKRLQNSPLPCKSPDVL